MRHAPVLLLVVSACASRASGVSDTDGGMGLDAAAFPDTGAAEPAVDGPLGIDAEADAAFDAALADVESDSTPDAGSMFMCPVEDPWTATTPLPAPRMNLAAATYNGYAYAIGGFDATTTRTDDVWYAPLLPDGTVGTWQATENYPTTIDAHRATACHGCLYVSGGNPCSSCDVDSVRFAPINPDGTLGMWQDTTAMPFDRAAHGFVCAGDTMYVVGGSDSTCHEDVVYAPINPDCTLGTWTATTPLPGPRNTLGAVAWGNRMYVVGGYECFPISAPIDEVFYADINPDGTLGAWQTGPTLPSPRRSWGTVVQDGYLIVVDGEQDAVVLRAPILPDGTVGAWESAPSLPSGRGPVATAAGGYAYNIGGGPAPGTDEVVFLPIPRRVDYGDVALNGTQPADGDSLTTGGWLDNGGTSASIAYSSAQAQAGSVSMRTSGYNGAGGHFALPEGQTCLSAEIWYRTDAALADEFRVSAPNGAVAIMTEGFCGFGDVEFGYRFNDPSGSSIYGAAIPGAPAYAPNTWYRLRIDIAGLDVTLTVSDGLTTGTAEFTMDTELQYDEIRIGIDQCGGGSHTAYWDNLVVEW